MGIGRSWSNWQESWSWTQRMKYRYDSLAHWDFQRLDGCNALLVMMTKTSVDVYR